MRRLPLPADASVARLRLPLGAGVLALLALGAACPDEKKDPPPTAEAPPSPTKAPPSPTKALPGAEAPAPPPRARFTSKPKGARVTVVYTASVQGYVAPCGCTAEPLGGVARLAAALDEVTAKHEGQVLFLDAGDLLFEKLDDTAAADACQAEARQALLVGTYARKGLAATTLGPLDDVRGAAWRDALMAKQGVVTVLANPPRAASEGATFVGRLLKKVGDVTVGVTGVRAASHDEVPAAAAALAKEVKALKAEGADLIVVLTQAKRAQAANLASQPGMEAVDVMIIGHAPGELPAAPQRSGDRGPILVASGMQAQHLGVLEIELAGRSGPLALDDRAAAAERRASLLKTRIKQYSQRVAEEPAGAKRDFLQQKLDKAQRELQTVHTDALNKPPPAGAHVTARAIALTRGSDEEPAAKAALEGYEASIPALVRTCEANVTCPEPAEGQATFVGAQACFSCHKQAVQFWNSAIVELPFVDDAGNKKTRKVGHSKAWKTLVDANKASDRSCVGCHSIGFMAPGGYCKTSEVGFRKNVQCESCHGPGSNHVAAMGGKATLTIPEVTEAVCRSCHHVPHIPTTESFVYEDKLLHVLGPGHGEVRKQALEAARAAP
jgi:hypothetical protein